MSSFHNSAMRILDRRTAVVSTLWSLNPINHPISFSDTVNLIISNCPETFRRAVKDSNRFLYRGESNFQSSTLLHPEPDLLSPGTYGDDPDALRFFQCLEDQLPESTVRPSVGHIATASKQTAAHWGTPVSIWPMGEQLTYLWPCQDDDLLIYPPNDCRIERFAVDDRLAQALMHGTEVMFAVRDHAKARPCSFLACPSRYDNDLKLLLRQCNYGL